jgi:hypothetical protein
VLARILRGGRERSRRPQGDPAQFWSGKRSRSYGLREEQAGRPRASERRDSTRSAGTGCTRRQDRNFDYKILMQIEKLGRSGVTPPNMRAKAVAGLLHCNGAPEYQLCSEARPASSPFSLNLPVRSCGDSSGAITGSERTIEPT